MNKQLCAILALLLVVAPLPVSAEEQPEYVTQDGIVYRYLPQTDSVNVYEITEVLDTRISSVTIPAQIDGVDVLCTTRTASVWNPSQSRKTAGICMTLTVCCFQLVQATRKFIIWSCIPAQSPVQNTPFLPESRCWTAIRHSGTVCI